MTTETVKPATTTNSILRDKTIKALEDEKYLKHWFNRSQIVSIALTQGHGIRGMYCSMLVDTAGMFSHELQQIMTAHLQEVTRHFRITNDCDEHTLAIFINTLALFYNFEATPIVEAITNAFSAGEFAQHVSEIMVELRKRQDQLNTLMCVPPVGNYGNGANLNF